MDAEALITRGKQSVPGTDQLYVHIRKASRSVPGTLRRSLCYPYCAKICGEAKGPRINTLSDFVPAGQMSVGKQRSTAASQRTAAQMGRFFCPFLKSVLRIKYKTFAPGNELPADSASPRKRTTVQSSSDDFYVSPAIHCSAANRLLETFSLSLGRCVK